MEVLNAGDSPLRRHWNRKAVAELVDAPASHVIVGENGGTVASAAIYQERTLVARGPLKAAWFDGYFGGSGKRLDTIQAALGHARGVGCAAALWPDMGTVPRPTLLRAGFIPFPKRLTMGGIGLNGFTVEPSPSYHVDVR
jgi:hypothetical protein